MRASSPGAIALSATFHAAVIGALIGVSMWVQKANEITPQIFDIVDMEGIEIGDHFEMPGAPSKNPGVKFSKPKTKRVKIPSAQEIAAAQEKAEREAAKEASKAGKSSPDKPAPSRNKTTSYAEFQQKNSKQLAANQKVRSGGSKGAAAPGIDAQGIVDDLMKTAAGPRGDGGGTGGSKVMIPALSAYFDRLISALRAAHEMPDSVNDLLTAKVSFFLAADGSISNVKIVTSSGSSDFDASVVEAFRKVRSVGAVPGGKSGTYVVPFRMAE
ncbi:MAG TPA: cell envelope integrity protein TolA [Opitutaceae bacterium]|nr:cell envelope integrity protein TolA [Opitutaceae bacterium]